MLHLTIFLEDMLMRREHHQAIEILLIIAKDKL